MNAMLTLALACLPTPHPSYFSIDVEARQPIALTLNGQPIQAGKRYKTEPIIAKYVVITAQFVDGDEIVSKSWTIRLAGGHEASMTITINAMAAERLAGAGRKVGAGHRH